ncbi:MAG: Gfo/Idh/MocA family protein [Anaerolineae bacterium]
MEDKVRIGFIGSGNIALWHVDRLQAAGQNEIVALSDPNAASLENMKQKRPQLAAAPTYTDYREMLDKADIDAVEIQSPHCFHTQQILDSLDAGKHVLCEKPLTSSVAEAHRVLAKRDAGDRVLMISYQRHFSPVYRYMRQQAQSGAIGKVQNAVLVLTQDWLRSQRGTWRQDPRLSCGGQLNDSGSHVVDMMLWCTGLQAQEVYAQQNSFDVPVDVDSAITVRFTNGAIGNVTVLGSTAAYWEMFGIWGTEGGVSYDITGGLRCEAFGCKVETPALPEASSDPDANFVRAILGQEEVQVPAECGLRVIELTEAAWRSAADGRAVKVGEL